MIKLFIEKENDVNIDGPNHFSRPKTSGRLYSKVLVCVQAGHCLMALRSISWCMCTE